MDEAEMTQSATVTKLAKVWRWVGKVKKHVATLQKGFRIQGTRNGSIFNIVSPVNGFTNVGWLKLDVVVVTPPPVEPPPDVTGLARIAWDYELAEFNYKSRTADPKWTGLKSTPAAFRFYPEPQISGEFRVNLSDWGPWILESLQGGNQKKFDYYGRDTTGLFNRIGWPSYANVTTSGNYFKVIDEVPGWVKVNTLIPADLPLAIRDGMTHATHPDLIHRFAIVGWKNGETTHHNNTPQGFIDYPVVTELGYAWIPARNVVKAK